MIPSGVCWLIGRCTTFEHCGRDARANRYGAESKASPEPLTVKGMAHWAPFLFDDEIPIIHSDQDTITFRGLSEFLGMKIYGSMDRVTGSVTMQALGDKWNYSYALKCKPTQRMF